MLADFRLHYDTSRGKESSSPLARSGLPLQTCRIRHMSCSRFMDCSELPRGNSYAEPYLKQGAIITLQRLLRRAAHTPLG